MLAIYKLRCKKFFAAVFYSPSATTFREKIPLRLTRKDAMLPCNIPSLLTDVPFKGAAERIRVRSNFSAAPECSTS